MTTNLVLDHLTFFGNLTAMNKQVIGSNNTISSLNYTANMTLEYSAINDLQLEDMSPKSWWNYVKRLAKSQANLCDEKVKINHIIITYDTPLNDHNT